MASAPAALRMVNELGALLPQGQALGGAGVIVGQHGNAGRALGQAGVAVGLLGGLQVPARGLGQLAGLQRELTGHHRFQRQFLSGRARTGALAGTAARAWRRPGTAAEHWGCESMRASSASGP
jgi:hypothetical protein